MNKSTSHVNGFLYNVNDIVILNLNEGPIKACVVEIYEEGMYLEYSDETMHSLSFWTFDKVEPL